MNVKRILVVDDEPSVARNLKLTLESSGGFDVLGETHATNTLGAARIFKPDLILLDLIMPGLDGGNVAEQLRADPLFHATPIIFLTALISNEETNGHEIVRGSETFLAKPVDIDELIKCIEQALSAAARKQPHAPCLYQ
jgi:CheY-like chemotaxis protein